MYEELSLRYDFVTKEPFMDLHTPSRPKGHRIPEAKNLFDYVYRAEGKTSIPSSSEFRKTKLLQAQAENKLVYISIPSRSQKVFRQIRLTNPLPAPLLYGPVEVYCGNTFLLESHFDNVPAKGVFRFDLGVESNIRVSRNMSSKERIEGMFIQEKEIHNRIAFSIQNNLSTSVEIELMEVLPSVSKDENQIQIRNIDAQPNWNLSIPKTDPEGTRGWACSLEQGQRKEFSFSYVISIPTDKELVGGNRRGNQ